MAIGLSLFLLLKEKGEDVEKFINEGVYQIERLNEEGWITDISYFFDRDN